MSVALPCPQNGNIYEYGMQRNSLTNGGNTSYYAYDGRGSVSEVLSSTGSAQMRYQYNAFGETTIRFNAYVDNPYRYNGEYTDYVPGVPDMQYLRARYYAPHEGRFFAQDTLFGDTMRPLTQNLYAYCSNNAVMNIDPSGNCSVPLSISMAGDSAITSYLTGKPCRCGTKVNAIPQTPPSNPSNPTSPTGGSGNGSGSGSGGSDEGSFSSPTQEDAMREAEEARRRRAAAEAAERERMMRQRYENGQMGLLEKTYFDQLNKPVAPKPEKVTEVVPSVDYSQYGKTVKQNDYESLSDVDLMARLIFHEDSSVKGQEGVAWTIMNRYSQHGNIEDMRKELDKYYFAHMKSELDKFWKTNEWVEGHPIQYNIFGENSKYHDQFVENENNSTQFGWESAIDIATVIVESKGNKVYFEKQIPNPFTEHVNNPYGVIQYVNIPSGTKNHFQVGNNMFLKN